MPQCFGVVKTTRHQSDLCRVSVEKYAVAFSYFLSGSILQNHCRHLSRRLPKRILVHNWRKQPLRESLVGSPISAIAASRFLVQPDGIPQLTIAFQRE